MSKPVVTFGEIMGRFAPERDQRFSQAVPGSFRLTLAGAEANVAASIAMLGGTAVFVTALPQHPLADAVLINLKGLGIETRHIVRADQGRLGLLFLEPGANQRPSRVIYDRENSTFALVAGDSYPWQEIFAGAGWLHLSGVTPALSQLTFEACLTAAKIAKSLGLCVSCDLNFRQKLWRWNPSFEPQALAQKSLREILPFVDVILGNEEDYSTVLGVHAKNTEVARGQLAPLRYKEVAWEIAQQFPQVSHVGITLRESISATHNNWGGMLYDCRTQISHFAPWQNDQYVPYRITNIVDRVGAGDAFAAGLIYAMSTPELNTPTSAIAFAVASSCLAHSIAGDFNYTSREETEKLMNEGGAGRIVR